MSELPLSGIEWQSWADQLLQRYYGPGEYQKVPDKDKGDAGIEGFTVTSGCAYQAYGPEEPLSIFQRREKHRNKITQDIKKFINNHKLLAGIFGRTKISKWILLVPKFDSKDVIIHANKKTDEVLAARLSYVAGDFRVVVEDEKAFAVQRDELLRTGIGRFNISAIDPDDDEIVKWSDVNTSLTRAVNTKLSKIPSLDTDEKQHSFGKEVIRHFLVGQNTLEELRKYPDFYEHVRRIKGSRERFLAIESLAHPKKGFDFLNDSLDRYEKEVRTAIPSFPHDVVDSLKWEAVTDWIIRCPLDFQ